MKQIILLFFVILTGCSVSKHWCSGKCGYTFTNQKWKDGFIPNIEIDTMNIIHPVVYGVVYPINRFEIPVDTTNCKHPITQTTLAYCPDGGFNTVSCFSCGKILGKQ